ELHLLGLGQTLVVFYVVFLVLSLPLIVPARLGFQDLDFGDLTFILIFSLCSLILLHFSSLVASPVTLHFAMFFTLGLDSVFLRMCGVSLLELSSLLFRALWFFIGIWYVVVLFVRCLIAFICVPQFADFVLSLSLSLFSQLVTLFIVGCVSGGFPFRHVRHSRFG
ncbi:hypothetical protein IGI04_006770, partial [Brassica rapa subsp. trilocularis]